VDALLDEAQQLGIGLNEILDLIKRRDRAKRSRPEEK
jgi:hypothetical protein